MVYKNDKYVTYETGRLDSECRLYGGMRGRMKYHFYVGTYSVEGSQGIYHGELDTDSQTLEIKSSYPEHSNNPSFLAVTGKRLYAVNEMPEGGTISSYERNGGHGGLKFLNNFETQGSGRCHVIVWPDKKHISIANYKSGSLAVCALDEGGVPCRTTAFVQHEGVGHDSQGRQEGPHVHSTGLSADGKFLYAADLGLDQVFCYEILEDGGLKPADVKRQIWVPAGEGPRHFTFTPDGEYLYLVTEMGNRLYVMKRDGETGGYTEIQSLPTIPENAGEDNAAADIHLSADLRYLYVSNRGEDCIAGYSLDEKTGRASCIGYFPFFGKWPRNFCITPDDRYVLAANQFSHNVVFCPRDPETGVIGEKLGELSIPQPVFVTVTA